LFQKWFDVVDTLDFQFSIYIYKYFWFRAFLGNFFKNWAIFSKTSGHPVGKWKKQPTLKIAQIWYLFQLNENVTAFFGGNKDYNKIVTYDWSKAGVCVIKLFSFVIDNQ
jgi:hypothetical protein